MTQTASLPTPQDAYNLLHNEIYVGRFQAKLAAAGYGPQNDQQLKSALALGQRLRREGGVVAQKQAAAHDPFGAVLNGLDQRDPAQMHAKIGAALAAEPDIHDAVLSMLAMRAAAPAAA